MKKVIHGVIQGEKNLKEFKEEYKRCGEVKKETACPYSSSTCMYAVIDEDWTICLCMKSCKNQ